MERYKKRSILGIVPEGRVCRRSIQRLPTDEFVFVPGYTEVGLDGGVAGMSFWTVEAMRMTNKDEKSGVDCRRVEVGEQICIRGANFGAQIHRTES